MDCLTNHIVKNGEPDGVFKLVGGAINGAAKRREEGQRWESDRRDLANLRSSSDEDAHVVSEASDE